MSRERLVDMRSQLLLSVLLLVVAGCGDDGPATADADVVLVDAMAAVDAPVVVPDAPPPDASLPADAGWPDAMPADIYFQDFESDDGGYTHSGAGDEWAHGTAAGVPVASCYSGTSCWGTDLVGDYGANSNQNLESPVINVPDVPGTIKLSFAHSYEVEGTFYDWVTMAFDINGNGYETLFTYTGSQTHQDWEVLEVDISAARGGTVQFRWGVGSDATEHYAGYYIDDVRVFVE